MEKIDNDTLNFVFGKQDSHNSKPEVIEMFDSNKHNDNKKEKDNSLSPLLENERDNEMKQKPPLAGPEVDDLDGDITVNGGNGPFHGIDDGTLDTYGDKPHVLDIDGDDLPDDKTEPGTREENGDTGDDDLSPRFGEVPSIDVNTYQQKKNLAQGMMDLALLSANANQLRYVIESSSSHPYYYPSLVFITFSVIFQIAVGVGLIMNSRYDVNKEHEIHKADKINNFTVLGIFLITVVNVFITAFSVATAPVIVQAGAAAVQQAG